MDLHAQALALVPWLSERMQREPHDSMKARYQILSAFIESTRGKVICDPRWTLTADPDPDCQDAAAEIERLREIEKDWQAMRDERDAARTGYDCLLGENRELVKLEVENERLREALRQITLFSGQLDLARDGNLQTAVEIARAALSGKTEE